VGWFISAGMRLSWLGLIGRTGAYQRNGESATLSVSVGVHDVEYVSRSWNGRPRRGP